MQTKNIPLAVDKAMEHTTELLMLLQLLNMPESVKMVERIEKQLQFAKESATFLQTL